ncbi:MAG: aconitase/3-isopropylmalate dehydratase large subunit family protein [Chloroflexota bacterium]
MGFTAIEKILMNHSVKPVDKVSPGDIVTANIDFMGSHEGWDAGNYDKFAGLGEVIGVFDPEKVGIFIGHHLCTGQNDFVAANQKLQREWAAKYGVKLFDLGTGICHIQIMELGIAYPGRLLVFGDSHTCAYGAVGAMSTQCGAEMVEVLLTGKMWFKVPTTHKYIIEGKTPKGVYSRDVIQYVVGQVGLAASVYSAIEWDGSYIHSLPVPLRFPFTLMTVEIGGKCSFIEPDEITLAYLKDRVKVPFKVVKSDPDAKFEKTFKFDVSKLEPQVAAPSSPANTQRISEAKGARIDQVCIGTCTGSSIYDLRVAAEVLKGRKVKARTLVVPGTRESFRLAAAEGLFQVFADAGADVFPPHCGTCQTLSMGHLAPGEVQMHCGPRNWTGRTAEGSFAYLASPATCAASAIEGKVADCRDYL